MFEATDVLSVLGAVKVTFETAKAGVEAVKGLLGPKADPTVKEKLNELKSHLLDAQDKVLSLREAMQGMKEENLTLTEELTKLKRDNQSLAPKEPDWKSKLVFGVDGITFSEPVPRQPPGPFCTTCYSATQRLIALTPRPPTFARHFGKYHCVECDSKQPSRSKR